MILPVKKPYRITSPYGWRTLQKKQQFHDGIDFVSSSSKDVLSILDGVVMFDMDNYDEALRWTDGKHSGGNMIIIKHEFNGKKYFARYLHLGKNTVKKSETIKEGHVIGQYSDVGYSFGAHLHFDLYDDKWKKIDPTFIFEGVK
jgi:murein DD-endopeptidase MepM/ murein hydrolase activator NlpD